MDDIIAIPVLFAFFVLKILAFTSFLENFYYFSYNNCLCGNLYVVPSLEHLCKETIVNNDLSFTRLPAVIQQTM